MKKITLCLMLVVVLILIPGAIFATVGVKEAEDETALIDAVKTSGTVKLTDNIDLKSRLLIDTGVDVILDLNGKTLDLPTQEEWENYGITVKGKLTIIGNGTINVNGLYGIGVVGSLIVENGIFNCVSGDYIIGNWGTTTIKDGTFNANYCAVNGFAGGKKVEIKGGKFINNDTHPVLGSISITAGEFNQLVDSRYLEENAEIKIILDRNIQTKSVKEDGVVQPSTVTFSKGVKVTIDLNGYNITGDKRVLVVEGAKLTVKGKGKMLVVDNLDPVIAVKGSNNKNNKNYTTVNVEKGVELEGLYGLFVTVVDNIYAYGVQVNFNGKTTYGGIYTNGNIQHTENYPIINIGSSAYIGERGIYAAGYAEWNIDGATISGVGHGIGIKSGKFNIKNARIIGTGPDARPTEGFNNGMNNSGAAIQIESNKGYVGKIDISIENTIVESKNSVSFYEYLATFENEKNSATTTAVNSLKIKDSDFISAKELKNFDISNEFKNKITKFIIGGTYTTDVKEYLADGLFCPQINDIYVVALDEAHKIIINNKEGGIVKASKENAKFGEKIKLTVEVKDGYKLKTLEVVSDGGLEDVSAELEFIMPRTAVEIKPVFEAYTQDTEVADEVADKKEVEEMLIETLKENPEFAEILKDTNVKVEVEVNDVSRNVSEEITKKMEETLDSKAEDAKFVKYLEIAILVKNKDENKLLDTISNVKKEIKFTVAIPEDIPEVEEGYIRTYYIVRHHEEDGKVTVDTLDATIVKDGKFIEFASDKFSTFALAYSDVKNEEEEEKKGDDSINAPEEDKKDEVEEDKKDEVIKENKNDKDVPQTGDNVIIYVILAVVSMAGIAISIKMKK